MKTPPILIYVMTGEELIAAGRERRKEQKDLQTVIQREERLKEMEITNACL